MFEVTITLDASPKLQEVISILAKALAGGLLVAEAAPAANYTTGNPMPAVTSAIPMPPTNTPVNTPVANTPVAAAPSMPTGIPTAAPQQAQIITAAMPQQQPAMPAASIPTGETAYTIEQLSQAAALFAEVSDANRQQILNLLGQFGVQMLTQLQPEQFGTFATALRAQGAKI